MIKNSLIKNEKIGQFSQITDVVHGIALLEMIVGELELAEALLHKVFKK
jgi:hypothetical protein